MHIAYFINSCQFSSPKNGTKILEGSSSLKEPPKMLCFFKPYEIDNK
jgi:hypothetical protein